MAIWVKMAAFTVQGYKQCGFIMNVFGKKSEWRGCEKRFVTCQDKMLFLILMNLGFVKLLTWNYSRKFRLFQKIFCSTISVCFGVLPLVVAAVAAIRWTATLVFARRNELKMEFACNIFVHFLLFYYFNPRFLSYCMKSKLLH